MRTKNGFTIVEVLVSVAIMLIFIKFAAGMLISSPLLASYSKHKIEAAYAAQELIETYRQLPFAQIVSKPAQLVILDTKGNYANLNCVTNPNLFCGTATITVAPSVYTNSAGQTKTSATTVHLTVAIKWNEQIYPMTETYAEDIANDPILN